MNALNLSPKLPIQNTRITLFITHLRRLPVIFCNKCNNNPLNKHVILIHNPNKISVLFRIDKQLLFDYVFLI